MNVLQSLAASICIISILLGGVICVDVFSSGEMGYMCIRIPVLSESNGTLFALAEARGLHFKNQNCCISPVQDYPWCNDKDIVLKTSTDGGNTWSSLRVLYETSNTFFYSNPTPVYDSVSHKYVMIITRCEVATLYSNCSLFSTTSENGMNTWSSLKPFPYTFLSPLGGPPAGLQLSNSRLVYPVHTHSSMNFVLYSDDGGATFRIGDQVPSTGGESQIVEINDGSLIQQIRNMSSGGEHYLTYSHDSGVTWTKALPLEGIPNTNCQASLLYTRKTNSLLLSTVASSVDGARANLTIYSSNDYGKNWAPTRQVYDGPAGYSALLEMAGKVAVLYERGVTTPYDFISLSVVDV